MNIPKVSVIVCTYNMKKYLGEALDSVLALQYPNFEVVLVDDGSSDGTEAFVQKHYADRLRYVRQKNSGLFEFEDTKSNLTFRALTDKPLRIEGLTELTEDKIFRFERVRIDNTLVVQNGSLELFECAVQVVKVQRADTEPAVLTGDNVLFHHLQAENGLVRLEYCTVLNGTVAAHLQASDCIFMGNIHKDLVSNLPPSTGCIPVFLKHCQALAEKNFI